MSMEIFFCETGSLTPVCQLQPEAQLPLEQVRSRWAVSDQVPLVLTGSIEEGEVSLADELYAAALRPYHHQAVSRGRDRS